MSSRNIFHYLYKHIRLDKNEVFYIGIGTINPSDTRHKSPVNLYRRAYSSAKRSNFWKKIVKKAGYKVEIIEKSWDYDYIKQKEVELIKFYGRRNLNKGTLVNLTDGGEGTNGVIISEETRKKLIQRNKNRVYKKGYKRSEESKKRQSETLKGKPMNESCLKGLAEYNKNVPKEVRDKIALSKQKKVFDINTNKVYNSIGECAKEFNTNHSTLSEHISGKRVINKFPNLKFL